MANVNSRQHSGTISDTITSFTGGVDLVATRPNFSQAEGGDRSEMQPRQLYFPVAGDIVLRYTLGGTNYDDTVTVTAGAVLNVSPASIVESGTTVTKVTIIW